MVVGASDSGGSTQRTVMSRVHSLNGSATLLRQTMCAAVLPSPICMVRWTAQALKYLSTTLATQRVQTGFSPDSSIVVFSVRSAYSPGKLDVSAYEVASGTRLWAVQGDDDLSSRFVFTPDGRYLIAPTWSGDLLVYQTDTGKLEHRLPSGLGPVKAAAFDHDGTTLWLATEDLLTPYQPQW